MPETPPAYAAGMKEPCVIDWSQHMVGSKPTNCWFARVVSPVETVIFAAVEETITGTWKIVFTPKGRGIDKPESYRGPYKSRDKAVSHVARWAGYHWGSLPLAHPPRHFVASGRSSR